MGKFKLDPPFFSIGSGTRHLPPRAGPWGSQMANFKLKICDLPSLVPNAARTKVTAISYRCGAPNEAGAKLGLVAACHL